MEDSEGGRAWVPGRHHIPCLTCSESPLGGRSVAFDPGTWWAWPSAPGVPASVQQPQKRIWGARPPSAGAQGAMPAPGAPAGMPVEEGARGSWIWRGLGSTQWGPKFFSGLPHDPHPLSPSISRSRKDPVPRAPMGTVAMRGPDHSGPLHTHCLGDGPQQPPAHRWGPRHSPDAPPFPVPARPLPLAVV